MGRDDINLASMPPFEGSRICLSSEHAPMRDAGCIMQLKELLLCMLY